MGLGSLKFKPYITDGGRGVQSVSALYPFMTAEKRPF